MRWAWVSLVVAGCSVASVDQAPPPQGVDAGGVVCPVSRESFNGCGPVPHGCTTPCILSCALVSCDSGFRDCDGKPNNGCEVNTNTSANCGACGANTASACIDGATAKSTVLVDLAGWDTGAIVFDGGRIYWAADDRIRSIATTGGLWQLHAAHESVEGELAVGGGYVWWTTPTSVRRTSISGGPVETFPAVSPQHLTVAGGRAFFMEGSNIKDSTGGVVVPSGPTVALSSFQDRLYYIAGSQVVSTLLDGSGSIEIAQVANASELAVGSAGVIVLTSVLERYPTVGGGQGRSTLQLPFRVRAIVTAGDRVLAVSSQGHPASGCLNFWPQETGLALELDFGGSISVLAQDHGLAIAGDGQNAWTFRPANAFTMATLDVLH